MKNLILLPIFALLMSFSQCNKSHLEKKAPAKIKDAFFQNWSGGKGSQGILVTIALEKPANTIAFDSIYFQGGVTELSIQSTENGAILQGNFITDPFPKRDLILSSDPKEEFGNTPPVKPRKTPFDIEKNEAMISFRKDGEIRYFLVKDLRKEKSIQHQ